MTVLAVTGGCGFIGSHFIKLVMKSKPDWKVRNLDKLTYCGNRENTRELERDPRYEFIHGDINDPKAVDRALKGADIVAHFAAETHVDRSIDRSEDFLVTNVLGTREMLEGARRHAVKRFLHVSTDEVYGSVAKGSSPEDAPLLPNSPYSAAKAGSDLLARSFWKTYGLHVMITRSSNNFGPNQFPEKVIPLFITNLIEGKTVPLYGDGMNQRDWIYVEDNCRGLMIVLEKGGAGEIYNVGVGYEITNLELTRMILKLMGKGEDSIRRVEDRLGHDFRYSVDMTKLKKMGFDAPKALDTRLRETVEWYKANPSWWQPLKRDKFTVK